MELIFNNKNQKMKEIVYDLANPETEEQKRIFFEEYKLKKAIAKKVIETFLIKDNTRCKTCGLVTCNCVDILRNISVIEDFELELEKINNNHL